MSVFLAGDPASWLLTPASPGGSFISRELLFYRLSHVFGRPSRLISVVTRPNSRHARPWSPLETLLIGMFGIIATGWLVESKHAVQLSTKTTCAPRERVTTLSVGVSEGSNSVTQHTLPLINSSRTIAWLFDYSVGLRSPLFDVAWPKNRWLTLLALKKYSTVCRDRSRFVWILQCCVSEA